VRTAVHAAALFAVHRRRAAFHRGGFGRRNVPGAIAPDDVDAHPSIDVASLCPNAEITVLGPAGTEGPHHQPGADVFEAVSDGVARRKPMSAPDP
jgi:hypothetical protein